MVVFNCTSLYPQGPKARKRIAQGKLAPASAALGEPTQIHPSPKGRQYGRRLGQRLCAQDEGFHFGGDGLTQLVAAAHSRAISLARRSRALDQLALNLQRRKRMRQLNQEFIQLSKHRSLTRRGLW